MRDDERRVFDELLEEAMGELPERIAAALEEVPVVVDDLMERDLAKTLATEHEVDTGDAEALDRFRRDLCGLHSGIPLTEASVEQSGVMPTDIRLFREPIVELAGGWRGDGVEDEIYGEIWITLLHEIGHHFGLDEDDLAELGYE